MARGLVSVFALRYLVRRKLVAIPQKKKTTTKAAKVLKGFAPLSDIGALAQ